MRRTPPFPASRPGADGTTEDAETDDLVAVYAQAVRRARRGAARVASWMRILLLRMTQPGVRIGFDSFLGPRCVILCAPRGKLTIRGSVLVRDVHLEVEDGALLDLGADFVGPHCVLVARRQVVIGAGSLLAEMCVVRDQDHVVTPGIPGSAMVFAASPVTLGRDVWLGAKATVLRGVTVGDGAIVGAGAVVTSDVAAGARVAGVPAVPLRSSRAGGIAGEVAAGGDIDVPATAGRVPAPRPTPQAR
ncbi:acyltransferase [Frankia sp. AgB1.9]|uniref:acyltransferase n=1 Tax=unclassified Frankia TaxID=2632575 RepID=UPI0019311FFA|nr:MULTISPECIES: acyltransferase [unclassified Frankia]MBL7491008.1 acyltransferase [Frankia sp. AgW1.1]MBL7552375.1 acyltransferase [Frankia sp. AgB1.9]MBL7622126.1 acyltransferase [Frankia sp. AgB1.8]